jgi:cyclophilin family peptidyl-prolyl cis-trans isomerase
MLSRILAAVGMVFVTTAHAAAQEGDNTLVLELEKGPVVIELLPELAPNHVERIKTLARQGFYDGVPFHRVIPGFMAQTGDPTGTGAGGSDLPDLKAEFNRTPHTRGAVSMARTNDPDSANSQFFIVFDDATFLDGKYTVFGRVVQGMELVDGLKAGTQANNGAVKNPDKIKSARVGAAS